MAQEGLSGLNITWVGQLFRAQMKREGTVLPLLCLDFLCQSGSRCSLTAWAQSNTLLGICHCVRPRFPTDLIDSHLDLDFLFLRQGHML